MFQLWTEPCPDQYVIDVMYRYPPLKVEIPVSSIAKTLNAKVTGDENRLVHGICAADEPLADHITFLTKGEKYQNDFLATVLENKVAALIIDNPLMKDCSEQITILEVPDARSALFSLLPQFFPKIAGSNGEIHETAIVPDSCLLSENVEIGAYCVLGERVSIGANTKLHAHAVIYDDVTIGEHCTIHSGTKIREGVTLGNNVVTQNNSAIGGDGFGYIPDPQLGLRAIPQVGTVEIGNHVELGCNSTIDRATIGSTQIGGGTKIDNQVQIGHNVKIGEFSILCAQVGIGGSSKLGKQITLAGQVGVADHITITDKVRVGAKGGVINNLPESNDYQGFPAIHAKQWKRQLVVLKKLTEGFKSLKKLIQS